MGDSEKAAEERGSQVPDGGPSTPDDLVQGWVGAVFEEEFKRKLGEMKPVYD